MDLSVFFAGTGGSVPTARRGLPALLVRRGGERLLFDCGEGTQRQLVSSIGLADLDRIFLTHFHADHWLGLPGMLKTFDLRGRELPLAVYGPPGLRDLMGDMRRAYGKLRYETTFVELAPQEAVPFDDYAVAAFAVDHRTVAYGYALVEDDRPGEFDPDAAIGLGVAPGPDFGRLQRGEAVGEVRPEQVMGATRAGRKIVISGDTVPSPAVAVVAHDADLLVHEATFADEERERAAETFHATASGAAQLARDAGVRMLALTHVSTRYGAGQIRDEACAIFPETVVPRDFDTIEIPLPERGAPRLVRWDELRERVEREPEGAAATEGS